MYVCVCHAVTDRDIARAAANGLRTVRELRDALGVASSCGRCAQCAHSCLKEAQPASHKNFQLLKLSESNSQPAFAAA